HRPGPRRLRQGVSPRGEHSDRSRGVRGVPQGREQRPQGQGGGPQVGAARTPAARSLSLLAYSLFPVTRRTTMMTRSLALLLLASLSLSVTVAAQDVPDTAQ